MSLLQTKTESRLNPCKTCGHQKGKHRGNKCFREDCLCDKYIPTRLNDPSIIFHSGNLYWSINGKVKHHFFIKQTAKNIGLTIQSLLHFSPEVSSVTISLTNGSES